MTTAGDTLADFQDRLLEVDLWADAMTNNLRIAHDQYFERGEGALRPVAVQLAGLEDYYLAAVSDLGHLAGDDLFAVWRAVATVGQVGATYAALKLERVEAKLRDLGAAEMAFCRDGDVTQDPPHAQLLRMTECPVVSQYALWLRFTLKPAGLARIERAVGAMSDRSATTHIGVTSEASPWRPDAVAEEWHVLNQANPDPRRLAELWLQSYLTAIVVSKPPQLAVGALREELELRCPGSMDAALAPYATRDLGAHIDKFALEQRLTPEEIPAGCRSQAGTLRRAGDALAHVGLAFGSAAHHPISRSKHLR